MLLKTHDVLQKCVCVDTPRSDRKILEGVIRSQKNFRGQCRRISCLPSGHLLQRLKIHSSAVSLSNKMLTCWCRVGSSSCRLNNISLVPQLRLPLLRHGVGVARSTCDFCHNLSWFRTCDRFLACTCDRLHLFSSYLHNLWNYSLVLFGHDGSRLGILYLLD